MSVAEYSFCGPVHHCTDRWTLVVFVTSSGFFVCRVFPWIIEVFDISSYYFYKVIEVLVRVEDGLSRDVVKHLNHVRAKGRNPHKRTSWKPGSRTSCELVSN